MSGSDNFWVKIGVIATVLGTVFGYLAVAAAVHWPPFDSLADSASGSPVNSYSYSSSPSPQSPTVDEVKAALLEPSDLTGIDANLTAEDVALPRSGSCQSFPVRPIINVTRQYKDGSSLILGDEIETFRSSADADAIFKLGMQNPTCSFTSPASSTNISSQLGTFCDESFAVAVTSVNNNNVTVSYYLAQVRCGRMLVFFLVGTAAGSQFDNESNLNTGVEAALPKAQAIPGVG